VVVPWLSVVALSVLALFVLPKRYRSSTLILVESEKVPDSFVARVATEDRGQRLEAIRPEILSRTRLERVLEETRPYPGLGKTAAVELLRERIAIYISGNDGFTLVFVHDDPHKAQEVANRVATLFIEETVKSREQQVTGAVDFLATQVQEARKEVEQKDEALRRYKEQRMGRLPEQLQTNLATMQMLQQEMGRVEENLLFARERRDALARGQARPAGEAPQGSARTPADELADLRRQLAALKGRYTDEHPDVENLSSRVARLEQRLAAASESGAVAGDTSDVVTRDQVEQSDLEIRRLEDRRKDLEVRITALQVRVEDTPRTEQDLANLTRDYDKLNENYVALLSKQLEAEMAGRLEQRWKGDRFRMLDPANLPEKPYFPKPLIIIGLGAVLGLVAGLGAAVAAEFADPSIRDAHDLQAVLPLPVLARIPHLPHLGGTKR
jgi:polysaccharide chain length determinant protein (PEP-CTERM system associated)